MSGAAVCDVIAQFAGWQTQVRERTLNIRSHTSVPFRACNETEDKLALQLAKSQDGEQILVTKQLYLCITNSVSDSPLFQQYCG